MREGPSSWCQAFCRLAGEMVLTPPKMQVDRVADGSTGSEEKQGKARTYGVVVV